MAEYDQYGHVKVRCEKCNSDQVRVVSGSYDLKWEDHAKYRCNSCGHTWYGFEWS